MFFVSLIKYFTMMLCSSYAAYKALGQRIPSQTKELIRLIVYTLAGALMVSLTALSFMELRLTLMLIIAFMYNELYIGSTRERIVKSTLFSYALLHMESVAYLLLMGILSLAFPVINSANDYVVIFCVAAFQIICTWLLFKVPRLSRGLSAFFDSYHGDYLTCLCVMILYLVNIWAKEPYRLFITVVTTTTVLAASVIIFFWARAHMKKSYAERSQKREFDNLSKMVSSLQAENERLSAVVHKDNKLVPAMELCVRDFLANAACVEKRDERISMTNKMIAQLERLSAERRGIITAADRAASDNNCPRTGVVVLDSLISFMKHRASSDDIGFSFTVSCDVQKMLSIVQESDLATLLADLTENALIAVKHGSATPGRISVELRCKDDNYYLDVRDNGVPFPREVLEKLGQQRITTHKNEGGSGIGMMTVCEICRKYYASLRIIPIKDDIFSKSVSVIFDRAYSMPIPGSLGGSNADRR